MAGVEAFRQDMENLGVKIVVDIKEVAPSAGAPGRGLLSLIVREDIEEDLEAAAPGV